jgi:hypothetical protein
VNIACSPFLFMYDGCASLIVLFIFLISFALISLIVNVLQFC